MLRRNLLSTAALLTAGGLLVTAGGASSGMAAEQGKPTGLKVVQVTGTARDSTTGATGRFKGSLLITRIEAITDRITNNTATVAVSGVLTGNVTNGAGGFVRHVAKEPVTDAPAFLSTSPRRAEAAPTDEPRVMLAAFEVQEAQAPSCPILVLDIGPINLDLLGLVVDLSAISLDITAVGGAGNLLGNLLCAIANLLNGVGGGTLSGLLGQLNTLLSNVLAIINALGG